jgi:hypothetical protein
MRWPWTRAHDDDAGDPYWQAFIHRAPANPNNLITLAFANVEPGGVHPVRSTIHSPDVMTRHIKELGCFYGADRVAVVECGEGAALRFAIVCGLRSEYDTREALGIGGQAPAMKGLFVAFNLVAYIKELGYAASRTAEDAERLAMLAGIGTQGPALHIADVVYTDLPLQPDRRVTRERD